MKTGQQWLNQLPDWIQELWISNTKKDEKAQKWFLSSTYSSMSSFISASFVWNETEQGHQFWNEVASWGNMSKDYFKSIKNKYLKK